MQKALEQDSTVYEYDAVYDDIQKQRNESSKKILGGTDKRVILVLKLCLSKPLFTVTSNIFPSLIIKQNANWTF